MSAPYLARALKRGILPPENSHDIKNSQGGEGLFLVHWLSYEKLNVCILCATVPL